MGAEQPGWCCGTPDGLQYKLRLQQRLRIQLWKWLYYQLRLQYRLRLYHWLRLRYTFLAPSPALFGSRSFPALSRNWPDWPDWATGISWP